MNSNKDMAAFHKASAADLHRRAQVFRKEAKSLKEKRDFLGALKSELKWKEYRDARDYHKSRARYFGELN